MVFDSGGGYRGRIGPHPIDLRSSVDTQQQIDCIGGGKSDTDKFLLRGVVLLLMPPGLCHTLIFRETYLRYKSCYDIQKSRCFDRKQPQQALSEARDLGASCGIGKEMWQGLSNNPAESPVAASRIPLDIIIMWRVSN